jgi:hypothetical protein
MDVEIISVGLLTLKTAGIGSETLRAEAERMFWHAYIDQSTKNSSCAKNSGQIDGIG